MSNRKQTRACLVSVGLVWAENQTGTTGTAEEMICSIISVCSRRNWSIHCQHHTTVICPLVYIMLTYGPQLKLTNQTCTWPLTPTSNPLNILNYDDLWRHTTWPHKQNHYNNNSIMTQTLLVDKHGSGFSKKTFHGLLYLQSSEIKMLDWSLKWGRKLSDAELQRERHESRNVSVR